MKITKAVIPAAGLGTRMLPVARAVPKEVLPIVDRPAISYLVEEAVAGGISDILIITGRNKTAMEDYFDYSPEYEEKLLAAGREEEVERIHRIAESANVFFLRQHEARGLGHAILKAKPFTGDEPFAVLYGDDIIVSKTPVCRQLTDAYEEYGLPVAGIKEVPEELVVKYCTMGMTPLSGNRYRIYDMIEKPKPEQIMTNYSILGRVLLTPEIYEILSVTPLGACGELQLTDAMQTLCRKSGMTGVDFEGTRYDMGSKLGFLKANVEQGVRHPEIGEEFASYLKEFVKTLR